MYCLDNQEIKSLDELCRLMVSSEKFALIFREHVIDKAKTALLGLSDLYLNERSSFVSKHREFVKNGLTAAYGIDVDSLNYGVVYGDSLKEVYEKIDASFTGPVIVCQYKPEGKKIDLCAMVYTGTPQFEEDISNAETWFMPAVA